MANSNLHAATGRISETRRKASGVQVREVTIWEKAFWECVDKIGFTHQKGGYVNNNRIPHSLSDDTSKKHFGDGKN